MKNYIKPRISIIIIKTTNVICGSINKYVPHCNEYCRLWHTCRDRDKSNTCEDFKPR